MFNLFDILQSQAGPGMQSIGQQFGLTPDQSLSAVNALLPALAAGLQRSATSDPMGFGRMLGMAGANPYFSAPSQPQPPAQPDFFGQLFGSPMLSQAVLQQASSASGIGQHALRQMLPAMAGMVVAGIVHVMVNQPPPAAAPPQRQAPPPPAPDAGFPIATFWSDWMNQFVPPSESASEAPAAKPKAPEPARAPKAPPAALSKPQEAKGEGSEEAPFEAFQQMFQTGVQVQEQNAKAMQDIFDSFWKPQSDEQASTDPAVQTPSAAPDPAEAPTSNDRAARKRAPRRKDP